MRRPVYLSFNAWLKRQHRRADAVGALARRARSDSQWPRRKSSMPPFREHLLRTNAEPEQQDALLSAWDEHRSYVRRALGEGARLSDFASPVGAF